LIGTLTTSSSPDSKSTCKWKPTIPPITTFLKTTRAQPGSASQTPLMQWWRDQLEEGKFSLVGTLQEGPPQVLPVASGRYALHLWMPPPPKGPGSSTTQERQEERPWRKATEPLKWRSTPKLRPNLRRFSEGFQEFVCTTIILGSHLEITGSSNLNPKTPFYHSIRELICAKIPHLDSPLYHHETVPIR
jgi:hypothetical protein